MCRIDMSPYNWKTDLPQWTENIMQVITDKLRDDDDAASIENDWKFAAMVIGKNISPFLAYT